MDHRKTVRLSLKDLAHALQADVERFSQSKRGSRKGNPFANLMGAVDDLTGKLKAIEAAAVEQRERHDRDRTGLLRKSIQQESKELENAVELRSSEVATPAEGRFVVAGRVVDANSGVGLPDARVQLVHGDARKQEVLAESTTDDLGYYRHELTDTKERPGADGEPEVQVQIVDEAGKVVHRVDRRIVPVPGEVARVDMALDGERFPDGLARGKRYEADVAARLDVTTLKARTLDSRAALRLGTGSAGGPAKPVRPGTPSTPSTPSTPGTPNRPTGPGEPADATDPDKPPASADPAEPPTGTAPDRPTVTPSPDRPTVTPSPDRPTVTPSPARPAGPGIAPAPSRVSPPPPPSVARRPPDPPQTGGLTEIEGIGPRSASRLEQRGISDAAAVAAMDTARLARILGVSESQAEKIRAAARRAARG